MAKNFDHIDFKLIRYISRTTLPIILLLLSSISLLGQTPSDKGWFEADVIIGCAPYEMNITNLGLRTGDLFIDWEGDPNDPFNTTEGFTDAFTANQIRTNTYTTPGTYLIRTVDGSSDPVIENRFDFLTIRVVDPVQPQFQIDLCNNNQVSLTFDFGADNYDFYEIDFGDGAGLQVFDKTGSSVFPYNYAAQGNYTINVSGRLNGGSNVSCANTPPVNISTINAIPIPYISQLVASSISSIEINYAPLDPNIRYELEVDLGAGFAFNRDIDPAVNPTSLVIDDLNIDNLADVISLRMKAVDACANNQEYSNAVSSIAFNYEQQAITNTIDITYSWSTSVNEFAGIDFFQGGVLEFSSNNETESRMISYSNCTEITEVYMQKIDNNGAEVRSISVVPFEGQTFELPQMATPTAELVDANVMLTFEPTPFPFSQIRIYRKDANGDFNQIGTTTTLNYTDVGVSGQLTEACYRSDYVDDCGNVALQSEEVCVELQGLLRPPSAFSPNDDGYNDFFIVGTGIFDDFQLTVYNKWGALVFDSKDISIGWDGTYNREEAPIGTYVYKVSYNRDGQKIVSTGTVTIIR